MEPNEDIHYSRSCLISYVLLKAYGMSLEYSIGYQILKATKFDDIFCKFQSHQKSLVYLFDVKPYQQSSITFSDLKSTSSKLDFDLKQCFLSYLNLRKQLDEPIDQLAIFTQAEFDRNDIAIRDILMDYTCGDNVDLLELHELGIRRNRIRLNAEINESLVMACDPLFDLARKLSWSMFNKSAVSIKEVPKKLFCALMRDVFEESGFRKEFLRPCKGLCCEVMQFHAFLVLALGEEFQRKNMPGFTQLLQIEQKPYAELIELRIENNQADLSREEASWEVFNPLVQQELEHFFSLLVFYTNVPLKDSFTKKMQRYCDQAVQGVLIKICQRGVLLNNTHIDAILDLIHLRKSKEVDALEGLCFQSESLAGMRNEFLKFRSQSSCNIWFIKSCGEFDVSNLRIRHILEEFSCNHLFIKASEFEENRGKLSNIIHVLEPLNRLILVINIEDGSILEALVAMNCLIIVITSETCLHSNMDFPLYSDRFFFNDLSSTVKEMMNSSTVLLQGRSKELCALLNHADFSTMPIQVLLDWYRSRTQSLKIGLEICSLIHENFIARTIKSEQDSVEDPLEVNYGSISIFSGGPGIGKTNLLSRLTKNFQEIIDDHIVIMEDFKRIVDWFNATFKTSEIIAKLLCIKSADNFQNFVLRKIVEKRRVILLLDGFDEISLTQKVAVQAMLKWIQSKDFRLIIISTRPHRLALLKSYLSSAVVYSILPFTQDDQHQFLQNRLPNGTFSHDLIRQSINIFKQSEFLAVPLQCSILASLCENLNDFLLKPSNVANVVQMFIDRIFEVFASKSFDLYNRAHENALRDLKTCFVNGHAELAFKIDMLQEIDSECFENLEPYGLLSMEEGKIAFASRKFEEFFLVSYLVGYYVDQESFNQYLMNNFCKSTANHFDMFFDHHIRKMTGQCELKGFRSPMFDLVLEEFHTKQAFCLPSDKLKQLHVFFVECCSVEKQLEYLATSISKGQFGIFEAIYESLPISQVEAIRFTCQINTNKPLEIDISTLSEDCVLEVLTIVSRQQPLDFVERVIANYKPDDDDLITMAIKRNYRRIIQYLFTMAQNLTLEDEFDLLNEFLVERIEKYLTLTVQCGQDDLLVQVMDSFGKIFHPRAIKEFLIDQSLLKVLLESCQEQCASEKVVQRVVEFVEQHLSENDMKLTLKRTMKGYGELLDTLKKLTNQKIRLIFEALWNRYGIE